MSEHGLPIKVAYWIARWCQAGLNIPAIDLPLAKRLAKLHLVIHPGELYELSEGDWQRLDDVTGAVKKKPSDNSKKARMPNMPPCSMVFELMEWILN